MDRRSRSAFAGGTLILDRGMWTQLRLTWRLLRDERVSALKFAVPAVFAAYFISPVDVIPDFLLGIGQVDDLGLAVMTALMTARIVPMLAPAKVVAEHLSAMDGVGAEPESQERAGGDVLDARFRVRD